MNPLSADFLHAHLVGVCQSGIVSRREFNSGTFEGRLSLLFQD
jgi:hypothetical protein